MFKFLVAGFALAFLVPAHAEFTIYESEVNAVRMKGWADVRAVYTQDEAELVDGVSRLNINFTREMGHDWQAIATIETGVNLVGETDIAFAGGDSFHTRRDDLLNLRLGYVGVRHPEWGELTLGKQWGAFYDLSGITDWGHSWGSTASGTYNFNGDGGLSGTGRADQALKYRNSWGNFSLALQTQLQGASDDIDEFDLPSFPGAQVTRIEYDETYGATVGYTIAERHLFSAAYNTGTFNGFFALGGETTRDDEVSALAYQYGEYNNGFFLGTVFVDGENHELDNLSRIIPETTGIELFASYRGSSRFMPYVLYNSLESGDRYEELYGDGEFHRQFFAAGAVFFWGEDTEIYLDIRIDSSSMSPQQAAIEDDGVGLGMRYSF